MNGAWYLDADEYYVAEEQVGPYPLRQGDVIEGPHLADESWHAAQVIHPTCELTKSTVTEIQLARVRPLTDLADDFQHSLAVAGYREIEGERRVAVAHTFFLPPWGEGSEPCFADFRELITVPRDSAMPHKRVAAITHDCRVTFIRRYIYFRFRLAFAFEDIQTWEANRIANDPAFEGPKPDWAQ